MKNVENNQEWAAWADIHPEFTLELKKEWEKQGFDYKICKELVRFGLDPHNAEFAKYLSWEKMNMFLFE